MSDIESLRIDPQKKDIYLAIIDEAFRKWHEREWSVIAFGEFQKLSDASFLAYVRQFLTLANEEGIIDLATAKEALQASTGEYFSERKFGNTIVFYQDNGWKDL